MFEEEGFILATIKMKASSLFHKVLRQEQIHNQQDRQLMQQFESLLESIDLELL